MLGAPVKNIQAPQIFMNNELPQTLRDGLIIDTLADDAVDQIVGDVVFECYIVVFSMTYTA